MGLIPDDIISDVASRTDMVQVVGEYVSLKRAGTAFKGLCPFHGEKTPSFNVSPGQGFFKCFGCGEGGSVFKFLMKIEGWTFPEAVRHLAARVGVEIPELDERSAKDLRQAAKEKDDYHRILGSARDYYESNLASGKFREAIDYLKARGVDGETAKRFGLGYAPNDWSGLLDALKKKGITGAECDKAGLAIAGKKGHYDRFRDRIMFPVIDIWGKTIAFSGRELKPDPDRPGAKYINSPETRFYKKGKELFGLVTNKQGIRADGRALMVEGNFDVVTLSARGVNNVVAPLGTALTEPQVRLLGRYTRNVHLAFDADKAGEAATMKALPVLMAQGFDARVVRMPPGEDPDSLVQKEGREALGDAIDRAVPIMAFAIDRALEGADGAPIEEKVAALTRAGEILALADDQVLWRHYAEEIARRLEIRPSEVRSYIKRPDKLKTRAERGGPQQRPSRDRGPADGHPSGEPDGPPPGHPAASWDGPMDEAHVASRPSPQIPPLDAACFQVLAFLPEQLDDFVVQGGCELLADERLIYLLERVHAQRTKNGRAEIALIAEQLSDELGDAGFLDQIARLGADRPYEDPATALHVHADVVTALRKQWIDRERKRTLSLLGDVRDGSRDQKELLERIRALNESQKEVDIRNLRKKQNEEEEKARRGGSSQEGQPSNASTH